MTMESANGMANRPLIIYANFNECAAAGMFRRRLDGIRRYATSRGIEVATLGRSDCSIEEVPAALARLRPMGCVVEPPFLRPGLFRRFPSVYFDVPRMPKWRGVKAAVRCDEAAVAEAAYRELAAGMPPVFAVVSRWMYFHTWAAERVAAFRDCCRVAGKDCLVFDGKRGESEENYRKRLEPWVAALPRRCAIFAVHDSIAVDVDNALRAAHRSMPHDATLVGANAADPSDSAARNGISSVTIDFELSGYLAAKALLEGGGGEIFGPLLVERRKSTRGRGRRAAFVMEAVDMIRREACDGLTAANVIKRSGVTKSLFTLRFREGVTFLCWGGSMVNSPDYLLKNMNGERRPYDGYWFTTSSAGFIVREFIRLAAAMRLPCALSIHAYDSTEDFEPDTRHDP